MICELSINFFSHPFGIFWCKFLSYIEVLHVLSEPSELSKLSELIELPEVFSSMKKCLFCGALRPGDPLIKLLELRFVSLSSESSITSHPAFPDAVWKSNTVPCLLCLRSLSTSSVRLWQSECPQHMLGLFFIIC